MPSYIVNMTTEGGASNTITFEARNNRIAAEIAEDEVTDWVTDGDWGIDGARIRAYYSINNGLAEVIDIEIEPDKEELLKASGAPTDCKHRWTREGEGGLADNPGVWFTGGTGLMIVSHCRKCGLQRKEYYTGSQYNPGEHNTVEYTMPDRVVY